MDCTEEQVSLMARFELDRMKEMDAYRRQVCGQCQRTGRRPDDKMKLYSTLFNKPVHSEQRVEHTKW